VVDLQASEAASADALGRLFCIWFSCLVSK